MTWTILNLHYIRKLSCKCVLFWLSGSGEDFLMTPPHFCIFNYFPFKKHLPLNLNNLIFPWPNDNLYQVWLKLVCWFWRRRFFNDPTPFLHFCNYLPFEEDLALYLNNLEFPLPKDDLCQVWLKLACWFWRRRFLKIFNIFYSFVIISPWRREIPFI